MTRVAYIACAMIIVMCLPGLVGADTYWLKPNDGGRRAANWNGTSDMANDLWDLDHGQYYTWVVGGNIPEGQKIAEATLFFNDIRNWRYNEENNLWVHLLDFDNPGHVVPGTYRNRDTQWGQADQFAGQGVLLNQWHNLSGTAQDITYIFSRSEIAAMNTYIEDGLLGLGFDPDCHFYNNGICLKVETVPVPVPGALLLGVLGLGTTLVRRWRRRHF